MLEQDGLQSRGESQGAAGDVPALEKGVCDILAAGGGAGLLSEPVRFANIAHDLLDEWSPYVRGLVRNCDDVLLAAFSKLASPGRAATPEELADAANQASAYLIDRCLIEPSTARAIATALANGVVLNMGLPTMAYETASDDTSRGGGEAAGTNVVPSGWYGQNQMVIVSPVAQPTPDTAFQTRQMPVSQGQVSGTQGSGATAYSNASAADSANKRLNIIVGVVADFCVAVTVAAGYMVWSTTNGGAATSTDTSSANNDSSSLSSTGTESSGSSGGSSGANSTGTGSSDSGGSSSSAKKTTSSTTSQDTSEQSTSTSASKSRTTPTNEEAKASTTRELTDDMLHSLKLSNATPHEGTNIRSEPTSYSDSLSHVYAGAKMTWDGEVDEGAALDGNDHTWYHAHAPVRRHGAGSLPSISTMRRLCA